nr:ribosome maturation factor RimP [Campylobacter sp.]
MIDLEALANECGLEFYDSEIANENGKAIYRVFVTKQGGVSLDDCEKLSRLLSPIFDVEPPMSGEYFLEVSSPGLERKLSKKEHFSKSIGELVKITTEQKDKIYGKIIKFEDENLFLATEDGEICIKFDDIKKAKTYIEW